MMNTLTIQIDQNFDDFLCELCESYGDGIPDLICSSCDDHGRDLFNLLNRQSINKKFVLGLANNCHHIWVDKDIDDIKEELEHSLAKCEKVLIWKYCVELMSEFGFKFDNSFKEFIYQSDNVEISISLIVIHTMSNWRARIWYGGRYNDNEVDMQSDSNSIQLDHYNGNKDKNTMAVWLQQIAEELKKHRDWLKNSNKETIDDLTSAYDNFNKISDGEKVKQ